MPSVQAVAVARITFDCEIPFAIACVRAGQYGISVALLTRYQK